ncbi:oxidative stress survival, Svf1-like protein [Pyronema omphalodes]|nr:oxidative stress survival, Svf1-like protein [Pyronema omphalodes]
MFSWVTNAAQSALSAVAGTAEPIYGPSHLHQVSKQEAQNPKYEVLPEDLSWVALDSTCAETQTFYIDSKAGPLIMLQVIYSNVANIHVSAQLNVKVFYPDGKIHWSAKTMDNYAFDEKKRSFGADNFRIELALDNNSYRIISNLDTETLVDVTITREIPAFKVGKDARTNFGDDAANPWGCIRHLFWPKGKAEGTLTVKGEKIDAAGGAVFIMALQGMKPHHAASKWNFATFESENFVAFMMEFTTPPSYGSGTVNVGGVYKDGKLLVGTTKGTFEHTETRLDAETEWQEPTAIKATWVGSSQEDDKTEVVANLEAKLENRIDRVDVMAEVPAIIKRIVSGAVGTKPYIYQFRQKGTLKVKIGEQEFCEEGKLFTEATFINNF